MQIQLKRNGNEEKNEDKNYENNLVGHINIKWSHERVGIIHGIAVIIQNNYNERITHTHTHTNALYDHITHRIALFYLFEGKKKKQKNEMQ